VVVEAATDNLLFFGWAQCTGAKVGILYSHNIDLLAVRSETKLLKMLLRSYLPRLSPWSEASSLSKV
jgi:hypothetical protein